VRGRENLAAFDPGGVEPLEAGLDAFREALARESHTLKRALTDPRLVSGVGNAYSDEILHRARLSPFKLTSKLDAEETERLHKATREVLTEWTERLRAEAKGRFPEKVTAFHDAMAVHGGTGSPARCARRRFSACGTPRTR
jgi:formamidopyrimidine-DNA glycosylase